jgi:hypothetical protein
MYVWQWELNLVKKAIHFYFWYVRLILANISFIKGVIRTALICCGMDWTRCRNHSTGMLAHGWLQCFPQMCQVDWMSFGWWTIFDTRETVVRETQQCGSSWLKLVRLSPTTISCSKPLTFWGFANSPSEWHTHTIHVSRLKTHSLTCLLSFIYTDWRWHQ